MTAMVTVEAAPEAAGWRCSVAVGVGAGATRHAVRVDARDLERWARPGETPEQLVGRAFDFLLAREPATSILRSFDLAVIPRYFPEFDREIRRP
jgi:hypothetical protein